MIPVWKFERVAKELALLVKKYTYFTDYGEVVPLDLEVAKSMLEKAEEILKESK